METRPSRPRRDEASSESVALRRSSAPVRAPAPAAGSALVIVGLRRCRSCRHDQHGNRRPGEDCLARRSEQMCRPAESPAAHHDQHGVFVLGDPGDDLGWYAVRKDGLHIKFRVARVQGRAAVTVAATSGWGRKPCPSSNPTACTATTRRRRSSAKRSAHSTAASDSGEASTPTTRQESSSIDVHRSFERADAVPACARESSRSEAVVVRATRGSIARSVGIETVATFDVVFVAR